MLDEEAPEETRMDIVAKMGRDLGEAFYELYRELVWVHAKWREYRTLFGTDSKRVALLNRTAPFVFGVVQDALWDEVLLHVARLTDPPHTGGRRNLTVGMLPPLIPDEELRRSVQVILTDCLKKAEFARAYRNRRLAHLDLSHALDAEATPLAGFSREHIEGILGSLRHLMNTIDGHFRDTEVLYDRFLSRGNAETLLTILERAEAAHGMGPAVDGGENSPRGLDAPNGESNASSAPPEVGP